jgi:hypothetical protein
MQLNLKGGTTVEVEIPSGLAAGTLSDATV